MRGHVFNPETVVTLKISDGLYSLPVEKRDNIIAALQAIDNDAAKQLADGLSVRRQVQSDAVMAIMALGIAPWRLEMKFPWANVNEELGYRPTPVAASPVEIPLVAKITADENAIFVLNGKEWRCAGSDYRVVAKFTEELYENELTHPGTYRGLIRKCREACSNARVFSKDTLVQFLPKTDVAESWALDQYERVLNELNLTERISKPLPEVWGQLAENHSLQHAFQYASEQGLISLVTPGGNANLITCSDNEPKYKALKPYTGLVVQYGEHSYRLLSPVGARRGWSAERLSDGVVFRMKAKQVSDALQAKAVTEYRAAKEKMAKVVYQTTQAMPREQIALF